MYYVCHLVEQICVERIVTCNVFKIVDARQMRMDYVKREEKRKRADNR